MFDKLWNDNVNVHRTCRILFRILAIAAFIGFIKVIIDEILPYYNLNKIEGLYSNYSGVGVEKIRINIAMIIAAGFVWMRRNLFQKIALLCLIWVVFEYIWWWFTSYNLFTSTNNEIVKSMPNFLFLHGGQWWDILILVIVIANLICIIRILDTKDGFVGNLLSKKISRKRLRLPE